MKNQSYTTQNTFNQVNIKKNISNKKNIIVIVAESLEHGYAKADLFPQPLLPMLTSLSGSSFSNFQSIAGTDNTISAVLAMTCAIPFTPLLPSQARNMNKYTFPSAVCLSDILKENGYDISFYFADTETFSNKVDLLRQHSVSNIFSAEQLRQNKEDTGLKSFRAIKDSRLFESVLQHLASRKESSPFFISLFTINTHEPKGYLEKTCQRKSKKTFENIVFCTDKQVYDFVNKIKKMPFYKDTRIIVIGDHFARKNPLTSVLETDKNRSVFNLFINAPEPPTTKRTFTTLDLAPSILDLAGFEMKHGFGLGRSLFREEPTLIEKLGQKKLENELKKFSSFYKSLLKEKKD